MMCRPCEIKSQVELPPKENFHLFLLAGQSNMAGRGKLTEKDTQVHPRVYALSWNGKWIPAADPIHYDKPTAGVGLGKSFAIALAERDSSIAIGLVPAACGGSPIAIWEQRVYFDQTDSYPYDDAIQRIRYALKDGMLKGILWHQGESDSNPQRAGEYKGKLKNLIERFRKDLNTPSLPFIIGQLGQFPESPWDDFKRLINEAHVTIADEMDFVGFVSSEDLSCMEDNIHFNSESLRQFGQRYAEIYMEIKKHDTSENKSAAQP